MSTVAVPRNITSKEVVEALRNGLDPRYEVLPGTRMPRSPLFGSPRPSEPELIMVTAGPMVRAQVRIIPRAAHRPPDHSRGSARRPAHEHPRHRPRSPASHARRAQPGRSQALLTTLRRTEPKRAGQLGQ
jgi:hypothetical protein